MNIFILDISPERCARAHVDKHVVKMPLESSQMLATIHRQMRGSPSALQTKIPNVFKSYDYVLPEERNDFIQTIPKLTHPNHPCCRWLRQSASNYDWLVDLYEALGEEYEYRYGRKHASLRHLDVLRVNPINVDIGLTPFVRAMPDEFKCSSVVQSYRRYVKFGKKKSMHEWRSRGRPDWWDDLMSIKKNQCVFN